MFFWCFEVSQANAYILFCLTRNNDEKATPLLKFKKELIKQLIDEANTIIPADHKHHRVMTPKSTPAFLNAAPEHLVIWHKNVCNCVMCSAPGQRKRTSYKCKTCDVYLHPKNCFEQYHMPQ